MAESQTHGPDIELHWPTVILGAVLALNAVGVTLHGYSQLPDLYSSLNDLSPAWHSIWTGLLLLLATFGLIVASSHLREVFWPTSLYYVIMLLFGFGLQFQYPYVLAATGWELTSTEASTFSIVFYISIGLSILAFLSFLYFWSKHRNKPEEKPAADSSESTEIN